MKTLVIVRHAHRDTSKGRERDNGLDTKGKKQTKQLTDFYVKRFAKSKSLILSSPSKRCLQTVEKIAKKTRTRPEISMDLVEQGFIQPKETEAAFKKRVVRFCDKLLKSSNDRVMICSHGDWIPVALKYLVDCDFELKKGGWAEIRKEEHKSPELNVLIQSFS